MVLFDKHELLQDILPLTELLSVACRERKLMIRSLSGQKQFDETQANGSIHAVSIDSSIDLHISKITWNDIESLSTTVSLKTCVFLENRIKHHRGL
ncbi:hypothetical protein G9A89_017290 [Geosiphon pyriformis]|nr:hypothetical protein G9A89_017290 [Geosiphon pyriformis]